MVEFIKRMLGRRIRQYRLNRQMRELKIIRDAEPAEYFATLHKKNYVVGDEKTNPSIAFLIPGMRKGSGGHTSILRIGTFLADNGHDVYYLSFIEQKQPEMVFNARWNLENYKGVFVENTELNGFAADICVATHWISAYHLLKIMNTSHKAYFIQDYEPDFYPSGDIRAFVLNTYKMGYQMIALGSWSKTRIEEKVGAMVDSIVFPYDPLEYMEKSDEKVKSKDPKSVDICAYIKDSPRRGSVLLLMSLEKLYDKARSRGLKINISLFGEDIGMKYPVSAPHRNLGKLNKDDLRNLYMNSDFGVVFSYTNISLVPLEMAACGCPVVEITDGSYSHFFGHDSAILVDSSPQDFVKKLLYYIEHPEERLLIASKALENLKERTWPKAAKQFREVLLSSYRSEGKQSRTGVDL